MLELFFSFYFQFVFLRYIMHGFVTEQCVTIFLDQKKKKTWEWHSKL